MPKAAPATATKTATKKAAAAQVAPPQGQPQATAPVSAPTTQTELPPNQPKVSDQPPELEQLKAENERLRKAVEENENFEARLAAIERMQGGVKTPSIIELDEDSDSTADKVLILYAPDSADNDRMTQSYLHLVVTERNLPTEVAGITRSELLPVAMIPGLQEIKRSYYQELSAPTQPEHIQGLFKRGVLRLFSDESNFLKLATTDEVLAQDAIAKCFSRPLLARWVSYWNHLPKVVQERLSRREEELKVARPNAKQSVFGQAIT